MIQKVSTVNKLYKRVLEQALGKTMGHKMFKMLPPDFLKRSQEFALEKSQALNTSKAKMLEQTVQMQTQDLLTQIKTDHQTVTLTPLAKHWLYHEPLPTPELLKPLSPIKQTEKVTRKEHNKEHKIITTKQSTVKQSTSKPQQNRELDESNFGL